MDRISKVIRGAVTVPIKFRRELGWNEGDLIGIAVRNDGALVLYKVKIVPDKPDDKTD